MPIGPVVSERLKVQLPTNHGYQTPWLLTPNEDHSGNGNGNIFKRQGYLNVPELPKLESVKDERLEPTPAAQTLGREEDDASKKASLKVSIRDRIGCYSWTWFTMTMATGGIANVLHSIPFRRPWLDTIGEIVFVFNMALFITNCTLITLRFKFRPGSWHHSFYDQSESLFVPAIIVSFATILMNICQYGIPRTGLWLQTTMSVMFWIYVCIAILGSSGMYLMLWSTQAFPLNTMTPIWIFPAYPLLLAAPFASNLIESLPSEVEAARTNAIAITLGAIVIQGTGFMVSLMIYGAFIYRLMTQKLPRESLRPGIFVSVGPSGFTVAGLVHLGNNLAEKTMPNGYLGHADTSFFLKLIADLVGLWLWGLCIWFFIISVGSHLSLLLESNRDPSHRIHFAMTWYSYVFPNTALVTATMQIGKAFDIKGILIVGTAMAGVLVIVWMCVFGTMLYSIWKRKLLWPEETKS